MNEPVCHAASSPGKALTWITLAFFGGFAGVSAFGPIVSRLKAAMELDPLLMGVLAASPALTGSLLRIPAGALVDRMGGRRLILVLLALACSGILGLIGLFGRSAPPCASDLPLFMFCGVLCGAGIAVFSVGVPSVSYWYPQKRQGTALALYGGLGNLAPGLFALLLPLLVVRLGFTAAYLCWLMFLVLLTLAVMRFMKDAPWFQYREMGLDIDPQALLLACGEELIPSGHAAVSLRKAASDWRTWMLTFFYFVSFGGFIALTVWLPTYWTELHGTPLVAAGLLTASYSLSASLLRVLGGWIADRMGGERVVLIGFLLLGAGASVMSLVGASSGPAVAGMLLMALGMGFANAAVFKLVPRYSPAAVGGAAGIVGGIGAFGGFAIPPLMALFVNRSASAGYAQGFWVFVLFAVLCLMGLGRLRRITAH